MRDLRTGIGLLLLLSAAGCASNTSREAAGPAPVERADSADAYSGIEVQIDNQNISDMSIYLLKGGTRWLVGQAGGLSKSTLKIPASVAPTDLRVRLLADPIGGSRRVTTPVLIVPRGEKIYWSIGSDPSMSTASTGE
ncbi:MAG: hypothetical protein ABJC36_10125 [Gemmatimonadales bacterium]